MRKLTLAAAAAALALIGGLSATPALAQHHGGGSFHGGGNFHGGGDFHGGGYRGGGYGYRGGGYGYRGGGWGYGALGLGLGLGLAAPYAYGDYYDAPGYYGDDCGYWRWDPYWRRRVWVDGC